MGKLINLYLIMNIIYNFIDKLTHIYTNIYLINKIKVHRINIIKKNMCTHIYEITKLINTSAWYED